MHFLVLTAALLGLDADKSAACWPGFRGDGTSQSSSQNLPLRWSRTENIGWRAALPGYGQSSPVVWGGQVFITAVEGNEKEKCLVAAFDAGTGKMSWQKSFPASQKGKNNSISSRAAPTPVVCDQGLFVFFESGDLIGLSRAGEVKWKRSLSTEFGKFVNNHGLGSSLAQTEKAVFVLVDHGGPSYLLAVDKQTSANLWKVDRPAKTSWTTPVVTNQQGRALVVVSSNGTLSGYDTQTGKLQWKMDGLSGNNIPSPVVEGDLIIVGASENPRNPDREASARSNCCVRLAPSSEGFDCQKVWEGKKAVCYHASPLVYRGLVYLVTKPGVVYCLDLKTGQEKYSQRLDNACWATPIAAGDHIYFFGKDGVTTVLQSGPTFTKKAVNRLWSDDEISTRRQADAKAAQNQLPKRPNSTEVPGSESLGEVVYGVAAIEGAIFLRTGNELYCIRDQGTRAVTGLKQ